MIFDVPTMVYVECAVSVLVTSVPFDMKTTIGAVLRSSCPCWSVNFCVSWGLFRRSSATGADCWMCCLIWSVFLLVWYVWCLGCLRHISYPLVSVISSTAANFFNRTLTDFSSLLMSNHTLKTFDHLWRMFDPYVTDYNYLSCQDVVFEPSTNFVRLGPTGRCRWHDFLSKTETAIGVWCYDLTFLLRSSFQAFALRAQAAKYTHAQINQKWVTWWVQSKNEKL